jgi:two-component system, sporulation sensor kinase E
MADDTQIPDRDTELTARFRDVLIIGVLLTAITLLHQFTSAATPTQIALHDLYRRLYYLPILYAAFRFGSRGV